MARDYVDILTRVEGHYPQAVGGTSLDDTLRANLVGYANDTLDEINRLHRWTLNYAVHEITTTAGTQTYRIVPSFYSTPTLVPGADMTAIKSVYWLDDENKPTYLDKYDRQELLRVYNEKAPPALNRGTPVKFSLDGDTIEFFPCPDDQGPDSGNYPIQIEGYFGIPRIIETVGTVVAPSVTITVPDGDFLTVYPNQLGTTSQSGASLRGAGYQQLPTGRSDLVALGWNNITATTVVLDNVAATSVTNAQFFLNSSNWVITHFPKVLQFGMLREVATYLGDDNAYQKWESRFLAEVEKAHVWDVERGMLQEISAVAQPGVRTSSLRRLDHPQDIEIRGGA